MEDEFYTDVDLEHDLRDIIISSISKFRQSGYKNINISDVRIINTVLSITGKTLSEEEIKEFDDLGVYCIGACDDKTIYISSISRLSYVYQNTCKQTPFKTFLRQRIDYMIARKAWDLLVGKEPDYTDRVQSGTKTVYDTSITPIKRNDDIDPETGHIPYKYKDIIKDNEIVKVTPREVPVYKDIHHKGMEWDHQDRILRKIPSIFTTRYLTGIHQIYSKLGLSYEDLGRETFAEYVSIYGLSGLYNPASYMIESSEDDLLNTPLFEDVEVEDETSGEELFDKPNEDTAEDGVTLEDDEVEEEPPSLLDEELEEPPEITDESEEVAGEESDDSIEEEPVKTEPVVKSFPKQADADENDKNGIRRKKLYIAFIEWAKGFNSKNTFGSVFDKEAFHDNYTFMPHELRYFYRLANPMLCVLSGKLTFFALDTIKKINSGNKQFPEILIFAATPQDYRVFNSKDQNVYRATDNNGDVALGDTLAETFDLYIQTMIDKGEILNGPIEDKTTTTEESP